MKTAERKNARNSRRTGGRRNAKLQWKRKLESNVVRSVEEESEKEDTGKKGGDE